MDDLLNFIRNSEGLMPKELVVTGGEPLLHPQFFEILDGLYALNHTIRLNSNLAILKKGDIPKLIGKVTRVDTSIDHYLGDKHNKNRGEFNKTIENLKLIKEAGIPIGIVCVLTKDNIDELERVFEFLDSFEPEFLFFQPVEISKPELIEEISLRDIPKNELVSKLNVLDKWAKKYGFKESLEATKKFYSKGWKSNRCIMGTEYFVVDVDGSVYPCFHRHDLSCGNIGKNPPKSIFQKLKSKSKQINRTLCYSEKCIPLTY